VAVFKLKLPCTVPKFGIIARHSLPAKHHLHKTPQGRSLASLISSIMSDDEYKIPLQDQRVFGAGIKRKRVKFVPSTASSSNSLPPSHTPAESVSDLYLKLVLPGDTASEPSSGASISPQTSPTIEPPQNTSKHPDDEPSSPQVCEICNLPIAESVEASSIPENSSTFHSTTHPVKARPHEASLAHQVCLTHSHPPSHLDRNRKGLAYLSSYGWDPDSRLGLGTSGQGIQYPIKTKPKDDKLGIGVVLPEERERMKEKPMKLDAGKVRKLQEKDKKKAERLREMFYRNDDVERYLGGG